MAGCTKKIQLISGLAEFTRELKNTAARFLVPKSLKSVNF